MNKVFNTINKSIIYIVIGIFVFSFVFLLQINAITLSNEEIAKTQSTLQIHYVKNNVLPVIIQDFFYTEPQSIEEAQNQINIIREYIFTLKNQLDKNPKSSVCIEEIENMTSLIQKYQEYIKEATKPKYTLIDLGEFKLTAYCPCYECSEAWGNNTATGVKAQANHTVAVDPSVIPYGTKLLIGDTIYVAEDCGGAVKGNTIDIYFNTHSETCNFGVQYSQVYIYQE